MRFSKRRVIAVSLFVLAAALIYYLGFVRVSTWWHHEEVTAENTSWKGSWPNAVEALKVQSHSWKMIEPRTQTSVGGKSAYSIPGTRRYEGYDWGFKVVVEYTATPKAPANDPKKPWLDDPAVMPVESIQYDLYDDDGFHLNSITLTEPDLAVVEGETKTFQATGFIDKFCAHRASYGKVNIKAGYQLQKGSFTLDELDDFTKRQSAASQPVDLEYLDELAKDPKPPESQPHHAITPK